MEKSQGHPVPYIAVEHKRILSKLLDKIEPIDFKSLVHSQVNAINLEIERLQQLKTESRDEEKKLAIDNQINVYTLEISALKLQQKHYVILAIDEILKLAKSNNWGICINNDFVYLYNGTFWSQLDKTELQTFLGEASEKLGVPKFDAQYFQFREMLFKQFLSAASLPKPETKDNTTLINLLNGTFEIDLKGWRLRDFNAVDFLTYQLPFEFDEHARAPMFQAFLERVLPDEERQRVLAEFIGYVFIDPNVLKLEKMLFLHGSGANGKSVFYDIINALLGSDNISSYSLENLTDDSGYTRAQIGNKLINYASEISGKINPSIFKQLASGEPVGARLPYGQPFILSNYAKLIFNGNVLPSDVEQTHAFFRRFLIIPFDVTIPEAEQNKHLAQEIIKQELPGVLNWVLEGLRRLLTQEAFSQCVASDSFLGDYKKKTDNVHLFLEDSFYTKDPINTIALKDIYSEYKSYCSENGNRLLANRNFADRFRSLGYETRRINSGIVVFIKKENVF
jgi:putative DNA primase/helicase